MWQRELAVKNNVSIERGMDRLCPVGGTGLLISDGRGSTFWFKKFLERDRESFVFNPETSS